MKIGCRKVNRGIVSMRSGMLFIIFFSPLDRHALFLNQ
ncbi:hypothetical protein HMPREF1567_0407 [Providencia alcalifaciens PAL-2]|nr:hypothetical protein HMPREF1562_0171 [Providencia alcalifaciens F90-2004]EUC95305.1 hypothetical protein HMPREF1567_0407 [Providencia alcalifaciens PAL-2]